MTAAAARVAPAGYDVARVRRDFPILATRMNDRPLVYLDTAASAQKPRAVIDTLKRFYEQDYANIHRGVYDLSQRATAADDAARRKVQRFVNAADWREIVFTRNATEAINLVAASFLRPQLQPGDEILVTEMEHHANIVPWQLAAEATGAKVVAAPVSDAGELMLDAFVERITERTRMIAVVWVSNVLGTVNPVHELVRIAHARGLPILIDAAQAVQHIPVDVQELDADFLVFSGHKLYGPSGRRRAPRQGRAPRGDAALPGRRRHDRAGAASPAPPGTRSRSSSRPARPTSPASSPWVPPSTMSRRWGWTRSPRTRREVLAYATRAINQVPGVRVIGTAAEKCSVLTFAMDGVHPQDIGALLDLDGIAIRTGHHCAMPLHERFGLAASARASIGLYTSLEDIDAFVASLRRAGEMLQ